ncbi:MAG TPA: DUF4258 domain-containing protein [Chloroflexi bacterium]|nr:DUF4258 domain-containing protein [Chloroflexota bacterium]
MDKTQKQAFIRRIASLNLQEPRGSRILWSRHAITELLAEGLSRNQIERALVDCEIVEDYPPLHRPLPDCLVLGWMEQTCPVHIVVALDVVKQRLLIITVYKPSAEEWENDWKTRKS